VVETGDLQKLYDAYDLLIAEQLRQLPTTRILLLTDDQRVLDRYQLKYGDRLLTTTVTRTNNETGVHHQRHTDRRQLGREVMLDTYLAAECDYFIGNGRSNVSAMVPYLRDWPDNHCTLFPPSGLPVQNRFIHDW